MRLNRCGLFLVACAALTVAGCGKRFPLGERLLPASYGPPFGAGLAQVVPHHPDDPAGEERHAETVSQDNRTHASHAACNSAMRALLALGGGEHHGPIAISSIETVGHRMVGAVTQEYRCSDYTLSRRAWRSSGHGGPHAATGSPAH